MAIVNVSGSNGSTGSNIYSEIPFFVAGSTDSYRNGNEINIRLRKDLITIDPLNDLSADLLVDASGYIDGDLDSLSSLTVTQVVVRSSAGTRLEISDSSVSISQYEDLAKGLESGRNLYEAFVMGGNDLIATTGSTRVMGYGGADIITSYDGIANDWIHGNHGADIITSYAGNDTVRGGHGHDRISLGEGSDWVWGGIGQNEIEAGSSQLTFNGRYWERHEERSDGFVDQIFVPVDSVKNPNGNPDGVNADYVWGVGVEDQIFMHGADDSILEFRAFDGESHRHFNGSVESASGVGIYVNNILEAIVPGSLSIFQVDQITSGGFFA